MTEDEAVQAVEDARVAVRAAENALKMRTFELYAIRWDAAKDGAL